MFELAYRVVGVVLSYLRNNYSLSINNAVTVDHSFKVLNRISNQLRQLHLPRLVLLRLPLNRVQILNVFIQNVFCILLLLIQINIVLKNFVRKLDQHCVSNA